MNASFALAAQWLKTPTTANHPLSKAPGCSFLSTTWVGYLGETVAQGRIKTARHLMASGGMQPTWI